MIHVICIGNTTIPRDSCDLYRFYDNSSDACALYKARALFVYALASQRDAMLIGNAAKRRLRQQPNERASRTAK